MESTIATKNPMFNHPSSKNQLSAHSLYKMDSDHLSNQGSPPRGDTVQNNYLDQYRYN